ncbi:MAG: WD40/YVTN/BNR-like repeat-containing protein [Thermomicrobiales bacterium]
MLPIHLVAATGDAVARIDSDDGERFEVALALEGSGAQCIAVDPTNPDRVFAGAFDDGLYRSLDGGATWEQVGEGISDKRVLSVAIAPARGRAVYAGTEPSNLYRSEDDGRTWESFPDLPKLPSAPTWSFPPRPWTSHVRWIAAHPVDPERIYVGIELGGVMRSRDGGHTWEDRKPGSYHDSHCLATHPAAPDRVYEAAGGGVAMSSDAGTVWREVDAGMDRHYVWGLAVDVADPDLWYVSASYGAREAHRRNGESQGVLFRKQGDAAWEPLGGNGSLARPLPYMPYSLLSLRERPNTLIAGMQDGELWLTEDAGDSWRRLDVTLPSLLALSEAAQG